MDKWILILLICIALFLLSFCLLYRQKVAKFFKAIGGGIKSFFGLFVKKKGKSSKEQKSDRATKSTLQSRPVLLLPNASTQEKADAKKEEKEEGKPKPNAQEVIKTGGKLVASNKNILSKQHFDEKKMAMKDDFDKFLEELEKDNGEDNELNDFFDVEDEDDKETEFKDKVKQSNSVKVDGEDVDLAKLPPKIRRLLLSGMLDRKDDI